MAGPGLSTTRTGGSTGHLGDTNTVHGIVNKFDTGLGTAATSDVLKWNGTVYAPANLLNNPALTGKTTITNNSPTARLAFDGSSTVDGSTLTSANNNNKVGWQFNSIFQGGFGSEAGWGIVDPGFIFGHNLFTNTSSAAGALTGIDSAYGTLMELHISAPGATMSKIYGASSECAIEATGTSTTIQSVMGFYAKGPRILAGTVTDNLSTLRIDPPEIISPGSVTGFSTGLWCRGGAIFEGGTPNVQGSRQGVHIGLGSGDAGFEFANGTNTFRIDMNGSPPSFRWLQAGVTEIAKLTWGGEFSTAGLEATSNGSSLILKAPNGTRYRVAVSNAGTLTQTAI